ncbi:MAG: GntR family transcriptional regulator [Paenibacillus sp.]|jgi:multiple sugar transport system substrate-binding protein|nr:GntR family transcriptional regulator [Paenibacillus sp.]
MKEKEKPSRKTFRNRLDDMVNAMRSQIANGQFTAGDFLPSESELAERFQISGKSVRKGLEVLVEEGLIVKLERIGSRVTEAAGQSKIVLTLACSDTVVRDFALERVLSDFHRQYPSIQVKVLRLDVDYFSKIAEYMEEGLIDVATMNHPDYISFQEARRTALLEPLSVPRDMYPFLVRPFMHEGLLRARPIFFTPLVLCYNKEHFREAGLLEPDSGWTWSDAIEHARLLSRKNERYGLFFYALSDNRWPVFLLQSEEVRRTEDAQRGGRAAEWLKGINLYRDIVRDREIFPTYFTENSRDPIELFGQGKVSMIVTTYCFLNEFRQSDVPYDFSPLPYMHRPSTLLVAVAAAVNAKSRNKESAKLLVDYLTSPRAQQIVREHTLSVPSLKSAAEWTGPESMYRPSRFHLFREIIATFHLQQDLRLSNEQFLTLRQLLKMYLSDMMDERTLYEQLEKLDTPVTPQIIG